MAESESLKDYYLRGKTKGLKDNCNESPLPIARIASPSKRTDETNILSYTINFIM